MRVEAAARPLDAASTRDEAGVTGWVATGGGAGDAAPVTGAASTCEGTAVTAGLAADDGGHRDVRPRGGGGVGASALALATVLVLAGASALGGCARLPKAAPTGVVAPDGEGSVPRDERSGPRFGEEPLGGALGGVGGSTASVVVVVGDPRIEGRGAVPDGAAVFAPDGAVRGRGTARGDGEGWSIVVADAYGDDALARSGDTVALATAGVTRTLTIPPLQAGFDVGDGRVRGRTAPGAAITVQATAEGVRAASEARADDEGAFELVLDPRAALKANHPVTVTIATAELTLVVPRRVPYARISTHPGDVSGYAAPLSPVTLTLLAAGPDGPVRAVAALQTDGSGRFDGWLRDEDGERVRPEPLQPVMIEDADGQRLVTVAPLAIEPDLETGFLSGRGEPGDAILITLWNPWRPMAAENLEGEVDAEGRWSLPTRFGLPPATHFYVTERDVRGDETFHCYQVPKVHVEPGSSVIGIEALWDVEATLRVERGGAVIGIGRGGGLWANDVEVVVRDSVGGVVALAPGDRVTGSVDGRPVALDVPVLTATLRPEAIDGAGPPRAVLTLAASSPLGITTTIRGDGAFAMPVTGPDLGWTDGEATGRIAPGATRQVTLALPEGHAARVRFPGPMLVATLGERLVTGVVYPFKEVEVALDVDVESPLGASGRARCDSTGAFTATLEAPLVGGVLLVVREVNTPWTNGHIPDFPVISTSVPALEASLSADRRRVTGEGPPEVVLDGSIWYGEATAAERIAIVTRADGSFDAVLPAPNPTRIEVAFEEPGVRVIRVVAGGSS